MKVAIHDGNWWNKQWIEYCKANDIDHLVVNCYSSDIIPYLKSQGVTHLLWHFYHASYKDKLMARNVLYSCQKMGVKVYPDFSTCWYFDDKVSEKYLLEAIDAPIAPTWLFYSRQTAIDFLQTASYPLVFKLRGGAGASNVKLLTNKKQALRAVRRAFGRGYSQYDAVASLKDRIQKLRIGKGSLLSVLKGLVRFVYPTEFARLSPREIGYILLQQYIPNEGCDYRIELAGTKCWGEIRNVRKNDFRASGSGYYNQNPKEIPMEIVTLASEMRRKLGAQSMSFDFVIDKQGKPWVVEMSYAYGYAEGDGEFHWDEDLVFHDEKISASQLIIEDLLFQNHTP